MLGDGEVTIDLSGTPATLRPLLGAAITLDKKYGGFGRLLGALEGYQLSAAIDVVLLGLGRDEAERPATTEQVFKAGLVDLTPHLIRFVIMLANGGRPLKTEEEEPTARERPFG